MTSDSNKMTNDAGAYSGDGHVPGPDARGPAARHDAARSDGGFALLVSLIAIVGFTALATGGFIMSNAERRTSTNHHATIEAFYLADAGLNDFLASHKGTPPDDHTTYPAYSYSGGEAIVSTMRVGSTGDDGAPGVYMVQSEGRYDPNDTGDPVTRTVQTLALLDLSLLPKPNGAVMSGGGMMKNGSAGTISGGDACGVKDTLAGVVVPEDPGFDMSGSNDSTVIGDPPVDSVADPYSGYEDGWWKEMTDGTRIPHDHVIQSGDAWPTYQDGEMPVTYVNEDSYTLGDNESGSGLLIIDGNVTLKGGFQWDGMILAGGTLTDNGTGQVEGAVMTGLDVTEGGTVGQDDLDNTDDGDTMNGQKKYLYHSCFLDQVSKQNAALVQLPGVWQETF